MNFIYNLFSITLSNCDAPEPWQLGFQDPATPTVEGMIEFHDFLMFYAIIIACIVGVLLYFVLKFYYFEKKEHLVFTHSTILEVTWTLIPVYILWVLAVPSFTLLYSLDEKLDPEFTFKIVGHQWYWSYEYLLKFPDVNVDFNPTTDKIGFDSYMVQTDDLAFGSFRLLEVDNRVVLPEQTNIRLLITAADVLHSWAVPSFGIKMDACPGRLSEVSLFVKRVGVFYGQCSEICGVNHGFMPIVVQVDTPEMVNTWLANLSPEAYNREGVISENSTLESSEV